MATKYLKVCSKPVKTAEGKTFDAFFAYRQEMKDGVPTDVLTPSTDEDGKPIMIAKSIRVALTGAAEKKLKLDANFPYLLTLEDMVEPIDTDDDINQPDFYVTIDKDTEGNPRLDKKGNKHLIAIISNFRDYSHVAPASSFSLDDIDNF